MAVYDKQKLVALRDKQRELGAACRHIVSDKLFYKTQYDDFLRMLKAADKGNPTAGTTRKSKAKASTALASGSLIGSFTPPSVSPYAKSNNGGG